MRTSGLALGVASLFIAFKRLASSPTLWPYAALPSITLFGVMTLVLVFGATPLINEALTRSGMANLDSWYGQAGELALVSVLWLTSALVAVWLALVVTPPMCAPALEHLVRAEERVLGAPARAKLSVLSELRCGVQAQLLGLGFTLGSWLILTTLNVLMPALVVVTFPLKVVVVALGLAWSLLDYPLTLRGIGASRRVRLFASQPLAVLGFGLPFALLFWFPCTSILLLPVGAMAATRVVWQLAERDATWKSALEEAPNAAATTSNGLER